MRPCMVFHASLDILVSGKSDFPREEKKIFTTRERGERDSGGNRERCTFVEIFKVFLCRSEAVRRRPP